MDRLTGIAMAFVFLVLGAAVGVFGGGLVSPARGGAPQLVMQAVAHPLLAEKTVKPKRLEEVVQIDMYDFYFATPKGEKNPTIRLPAGKTVGLHLHNEGKVVHELAIGRKPKADGGYGEVLTELVPVDLFFYYGDVKAEVEEAQFGELEVDAGIQHVWMRLQIPPEFRGEWEIGCFVEGHYEQGMKTTLVVY